MKENNIWRDIYKWLDTDVWEMDEKLGVFPKWAYILMYGIIILTGITIILIKT